MRSSSSGMECAAKLSWIVGHQRPLALEEAAELGRVSACGALSPQNIQRAMLRCGHQPCGRVRWHPTELPDLDCAAEGVLDDVFCQREVVDAEETGERNHHSPGFVPE